MIFILKEFSTYIPYFMSRIFIQWWQQYMRTLKVTRSDLLYLNELDHNPRWKELKFTEMGL
jgi:hypothetical protein